MSEVQAGENVAPGLTARERWLIKEGYIAGFCAAGGVPLRNDRVSEKAQAWLDECIADAVTVEMALAHEVSRHE